MHTLAKSLIALSIAITIVAFSYQDAVGFGIGFIAMTLSSIFYREVSGTNLGRRIRQ